MNNINPTFTCGQYGFDAFRTDVKDDDLFLPNIISFKTRTDLTEFQQLGYSLLTKINYWFSFPETNTMQSESTAAAEPRQSDAKSANIPPSVALVNDESSDGALPMIHVPAVKDVCCALRSTDHSATKPKHSSKRLPVHATQPEITPRAPIDGKDLKYPNLNESNEDGRSQFSNSSGRTSGSTEITLNTNFSLYRQTDPFSFREGRTLTWNKVGITLRASHKKQEHKILDNCWGQVPQRQLTAIMGLSGSGKTSLLNVLAGRLQSNTRLRVEGDIRMDDQVIDPSDIRTRRLMAFVAQDDSLPITSTPREVIRFSAKMRLPRTMTEEELDILTEGMLTALGLSACADTLVGGSLIKGISGGERKRTSIGVELVTKPALIFLDEPTSGLDSFSALQCCEVLRRVSMSGAGVLMTIHQPSSEVFAMIDHLMLMRQGRVMYGGPAANIPDFFGRCGHPLPRNYNPADWVIEVAQSASIEKLEKSGYFQEDNSYVYDNLLDEEKESVGWSLDSFFEKVNEEPPGTCCQIRMLFRRELLYVCRDRTVAFSRIIIVAASSLFVGLIYLNVGKGDQQNQLNLRSQVGPLLNILVTAMMAQMQTALFNIPDERPVFLREYSTKHYSVLSYSLSHVTTEAVLTAIQVFILVGIVYLMVDFQGEFILYFSVVYLFALVSAAQATICAYLAGANTGLAMQMTPLLFAPQVLFSGFFISPDLIPSQLRWIQHICCMTYATRILVVEEFTNCKGDAVVQENCNTLMSSMDADPDEVWLYWLVLFGMLILSRTVATGVLAKSATVFY